MSVVFFLFKFDDANTNFCQFQYFFRKLTVKLQIKSIKEIRVLQGVRLPIYLDSLISCASQFEERGGSSIHFVICKHKLLKVVSFIHYRKILTQMNAFKVQFDSIIQSSRRRAAGVQSRFLNIKSTSISQSSFSYKKSLLIMLLKTGIWGYSQPFKVRR